MIRIDFDQKMVGDCVHSRVFHYPLSFFSCALHFTLGLFARGWRTGVFSLLIIAITTTLFPPLNSLLFFTLYRVFVLKGSKQLFPRFIGARPSLTPSLSPSLHTYTHTQAPPLHVLPLVNSSLKISSHI